MNFCNKLKEVKNNNPWVLWTWNEYKRIKGVLSYKRKSDYEVINSIYRNKKNEDLDIINPKKYSEKIQWLKLYYRDPVMTMCADKYMVRSFLHEKGLGNTLNELIKVYDSVDQLNIDELPDKFVLKASHGSGWNIIVKNKKNFNWTAWKYVMRSWMKQNFYYYYREWPYKDIKPRIICEKMLEDEQGKGINDYKVFCFNGEPKFIQVDIDRFVNHKKNFYDLNWNLMTLKINEENINSNIPPPKNLNLMIEMAKTLSKDFPHVRVDFYEVDEKLIFGEMTFYPNNGIAKITPAKYENILGEMLKLPNGNLLNI